MIVENGKILEATRDEFMPFEEYIYHMEEAGVTVRENEND